MLINAYVINLQSTMSPNVSQKYYFSYRLETIEMIFFLNRRADPTYVISELVKRYQDKNIKLNFIYDTVCVPSSHIHVSIFFYYMTQEQHFLFIKHCLVFIRQMEEEHLEVFPWLSMFMDINCSASYDLLVNVHKLTHMSS